MAKWKMNRVALGEGEAMLIECLGWRNVWKVARKWKIFVCGIYQPGESIWWNNRKTMWQVLKVYGVSWKLLRAVESFCKVSKACVKVGREEGWYKTGMSCHHGCLKFSWMEWWGRWKLGLGNKLVEWFLEVRKMGNELVTVCKWYSTCDR